MQIFESQKPQDKFPKKEGSVIYLHFNTFMEIHVPVQAIAIKSIAIIAPKLFKEDTV